LSGRVIIEDHTPVFHSHPPSRTLGEQRESKAHGEIAVDIGVAHRIGWPQPARLDRGAIFVTLPMRTILRRLVLPP